MNDPISWIEEQTSYPKFLWQDQHELRAAVGIKESFVALPSSIPEGLSLYGGMRFHPKEKDAMWSGFPASLFWQPEREVILPSPLTTPMRVRAANPIFVIEHSDLPSKKHWKEKMQELQFQMKRSQIDKVVFGRRRTLVFSQSLSFWSCVCNVQERMEHSTLFALELSPQLGFFGASPELLFRRKKNEVVTEAVAGTRPRGHTAHEDDLYEEELFQSAKDQEEFTYVPSFLQKTLALYCSSVNVGKKCIRKTHALQHITSTISGSLRTDVSDCDLLRALHPTPALGGWPREEALSLIANLEPFDRGWYGGPIGWATRNESAFTVAIRSCLLHHERLHAFAAAGIIQKSCAQSEWEEIERKLESIQNNLIAKKRI